MRQKDYAAASVVCTRQLQTVERVYGRLSLKLVHPLLKLAAVQIKQQLAAEFVVSISRAFSIQTNHTGATMAARVFDQAGLANVRVICRLANVAEWRGGK